MSTLESLLSDLKSQFESHQTPYEFFQESTEPSIQYYRWATEPQFHLALFSLERARLSKGKVYHEPQDEAYYRIGYNSEDQIVFEERSAHSSSGPYQKFIEYHSDAMWVHQFKQGKLDGLAYQTRREGQPDIYVSFSPGVVNTAEQYFFDKGRLIKIQSLNNYDAFKQDPQHPMYIIEYDALGAVDLITRIDQPSNFFPNGQEVKVFKKTKYSLKALTDIFQAEYLQYVADQYKLNQKTDSPCLVIVLNNAFSSDTWLPFQLYALEATTPLTKQTTVTDYLDFSQVGPPDVSSYNTRLVEVSQLLMQEIELKEKYELPMKMLEKVGKSVVDWISEQGKGTPIKVLALDLPDDFDEEVISILRRTYSAKACKNFLKK